MFKDNTPFSLEEDKSETKNSSFFKRVAFTFYIINLLV